VPKLRIQLIAKNEMTELPDISIILNDEIRASLGKLAMPNQRSHEDGNFEKPSELAGPEKVGRVERQDILCEGAHTRSHKQASEDCTS
jgi:hypothetical protein